MNTFSTDEKDEAILELLQADSSKTKKQIAHLLRIPLTTVHNRISKMEKAGVIRSYNAQIDWKKLGYDISAFIQIKVVYPTASFSQEEMAQKLKRLPGVQSVSIVAGTTDLMMKLRLRDTAALNDFTHHHLRKVAGVGETTTHIILKDL